MPQSLPFTAPISGTPFTQAGGRIPEYVPNTTHIDLSPPVVDDRGELSKGISRGIDNLQALGYGAAGLVSDALGNKDFAQEMYAGAQRNFSEAAQSPAAVSNFTDIGSASDAWNWFKGAAAEMLPSSVAALLSSGAGAIIFKAAAAKLATDVLAKKLVEGSVEKLVAQGVAEQAAKKMAVKEFFKDELAASVSKAAVRGAYTGGMLASTGMEAGQNWTDDVSKYGMSNTAPLNDLLYGIGGGAIEVGLGPEAHLAAGMVKQATQKELATLAKRSALRNIATGIGKAAGGEAAEEFGQQALQQMSLARNPLTEQNWKDNFNAAMGGLAGGALFGVAGGIRNAVRGASYRSATTGEVETNTEPSKPATAMIDAGVKAGVVQARAKDQIDLIDSNTKAMGDRRSQLMDTIMQIDRDPNISADQKQQAITVHENEIMALTAQMASLANQKTDFQKGVEQEMDKLDRKMVDASSADLSERANAMLYNNMTPEQTGKMAALKGIAEQHATDEIAKANTRISQHLAAIKDIQASNEAERAQGWGITQKDADTIKFHEQQIDDETKYVNSVKKNYARALTEVASYAKGKNPVEATTPGVDLRAMFRDKNRATDQIAAYYGNRIDSAQKQFDGAQDTTTKLNAQREKTRTQSKLERAFRVAVSPAVLEQNEVNKAQAQSFNNERIASDIKEGKLSTVTGNLPTYTEPYAAAPAVVTPEMASPEFTQAMEAPRVTSAGPTVQANPAQYQTQVEGIRQNYARQRALGAVDAWRAASKANELNRRIAQQEQIETNILHSKLDAKASSTVAALDKVKVVNWIKGTLRAVPMLQDIIKVAHTSELDSLPENVRKEYKPGDKGLVDLQDAKIYLFADNIHSAQEATRTVAHESIAHFGLRALMNPAQLENFMRMVARGAGNTERWDIIKQKYHDYNMYQLAEEYVASITERMHLSKVDMPSARRAWTKVNLFLRDLLTKMGWIKVTDDDIKRVALAVVYHLCNADPETIRQDVAQHGSTKVFAAREDVTPTGKFDEVRSTSQYEKKFGFMKNFDKALERTSYHMDENGKILPGAKQTRSEYLMTGLHDYFDRAGQLVKTLHGELRKASSRIGMRENFYAIEKTTSNRIATQVVTFLDDVVGVDPNNWAHTPKDGTLLSTAAKLIGTDMNIPSDPKELLHTVGKVLQAMHAEEANAELVRKQYKSTVMQAILKQTEDLEKEKNSGKASTERIAAIEKQLSNLYDQAKIVSEDIRTDLSGMSNEEAKAIQNRYINAQNAPIWEEISQRVQGINKQFLDLAVKEHLLSPEMRAYWDKLYQNYVPLDVWEAHMKTVDPAFASMGRSFDMSMFEISKERKGQTGSESNPIVLLTRKYTQLIQAIEEARVTTAMYNMYVAHPDQLSEIFEIDDSGKARQYAAEIKNLLGKADDILGTNKLTTSKDTIRSLHKRIQELTADKMKAKLQARAAVSDATKAKFNDRVTKIETDIQSAKDAIDVLKRNIDEVKTTPAYADLQSQIADLKKRRQENLNSRGYKVIVKDGLTYKVRKTNRFEGRSSEVITVFDNDGNKVRMLVKDPYLLASLKGTSIIHPGVVLQVLGKVQRVMGQFMTTYAPPYIGVNWVRDTTTALIHMRNVAEDIKDLHWTGTQADKAFLNNVFGVCGKAAFMAAQEFERKGKISDPRMAKMMKLYRDNGGYATKYGMSTYEATQKNMERALKVATTKSGGRDLLFATANYMQDISSAVENSTRLAAFTSIFEALQKNGVSESDAAERAAGAALDLTVNFTKRGAWSPVLSSLFLFSQASINSTVRIARAMFPASDAGKPLYQRRIVKYAAGLAAFGFMTAFAAKSLGGTDDDGIDFYDKLPSYRRNSSINIAVGRNRFISIPVAYGYQAMVAAGNQVADMLTGRATFGSAVSNMLDAILENFSFMGGGSEGINTLVPTVFKPLAQVYANQNYFGSKIYPETGTWKHGEQPDSQKYWSTTTETMKKLTVWLNAFGGGSIDRKATLFPALTDLSPASLEYVLKQYTGGVGQCLLGAISLTEKATSGHTEKLDLDQLPVASRFLAHVDDTSTLSEYDRVKTELEAQVNEYKRARAEHVPAAELAKVLNDTRAGRMMANRLESAQSKMSTMKSELNKIELSKGASSEEVYKKRILNEKKAATLAKHIISQARAAGVK